MLYSGGMADAIQWGNGKCDSGGMANVIQWWSGRCDTEGEWQM